ncbi:hypothetical protein BDV93DRAFT_522566 [Ceratobasidium sp. AG-I]|nr:hypothetical protein BDV93DRAFT_522566 [Ceratobasidium sp. AG-I]
MSVFKFPELASLVCGFADLQSCAKLLLTSQATFQAAVPFIWHCVNGAENLLLLLPNVVAVRKQGVLIKLECSYPENTKRFDIYARHVKHINVFGKKSHYFSVSGWYYLIDTRPLFPPNLISLTLKTAEGVQTNEHFFWIGAFASRSLVEIQMIPDDLNSGGLPWITWDMASIVFRFLLARCPMIQKLALHPNIAAHCDRRSDAELSLIALTRQGFYEDYIGQFIHLRELSTTTAFITRTGLQGLGKLPRLETLSIHNCMDGVEIEGDDLGEGFFPSLKNLALYLTNPEETVAILQLKSVVHSLESLVVNFRLEDLALEDAEEDDWLCEEFSPCLTSITNLRSLSVDVDMGNHRADLFELLRFEELKEATSRLRLQSLSIRSMIIDGAFYDSHLENIWPFLTHLQLPHQTADATILVSLSKLPNLQYLLIQLSLDADMPLYQPNSSGRSLHTIEGSEGSIIDFKPDNLNAHASLLVSLWPNIQHVLWQDDEAENEKTYLEFLNRHFVVARAMQNARREVSGIVGEDGANILVPDISLLTYAPPGNQGGSK